MAHKSHLYVVVQPTFRPEAPGRPPRMWKVGDHFAVHPSGVDGEDAPQILNSAALLPDDDHTKAEYLKAFPEAFRRPTGKDKEGNAGGGHHTHKLNAERNAGELAEKEKKRQQEKQEAADAAAYERHQARLTAQAQAKAKSDKK